MAFQTLINRETLVRSNRDNWVVIDCRFSLSDVNRGRQAYLHKHIPGAIYAHLDEDLSGPIRQGLTGRHPWLSVRAATAKCSAWGIGPKTQVIAYDDAGGAIAARLWWLLRWLGHDQVAVLDGGFQAWQKGALPLTSGKESPKSPKSFEPRPCLSKITDADHVANLRNDPAYALIDARAGKRFRGEEEPIDPVAGHIPGATNLPFSGNLNAEGYFLDPKDLRARYAPFFQNRAAQKVICYCGSGVTAAHNLLAIRHAGLGDGCLYAESWSGWISNRKRPVAQGK